MSINTVTKLLVDLGAACAEYENRTLRNLTCKRIQCDEIWAFCYAKAKNVPADKQGQFGYGDVWTWVAIDPDTKLVPSWCVGGRGPATAHDFMLGFMPFAQLYRPDDGPKLYSAEWRELQRKWCRPAAYRKSDPAE